MPLVVLSVGAMDGVGLGVRGKWCGGGGCAVVVIDAEAG